MKIAAALLALAALTWATWPSLDAFPPLAPEDAEALCLVRALERGREGAWEAIVRARNPRTVPALMTRLDPETLDHLLHDPESLMSGDFVLPRVSPCCRWSQRPHSPGDAFESALQAAVLEGHPDYELKQRGCVRSGNLGQYALEEKLRDPDPGVRFSAAFQIWRSGSERLVPRVLEMLKEHSFILYPWLEPVAEVMRRETSREAVRDGIRQGSLRALAVAAFLKRKEEVDEIVRQLNDDARKKAWPDLAWVLGEIGDARAVPMLIKALDRDARTAGDAAEALGKIRDRSALPPLRDALDEAEVYGQAAILRVLGWIGEPEDVSRVECYATSDEYTGAIGRRRVAAAALEELRRRP